MTSGKIVIRIIPTPAAQGMAEKDVQKLARITRLPLDQVRERIAKGKGIKIVTSDDPRIDALLTLVKSFGFSVTVSRESQGPAAMPEPAAAKESEARKSRAPARAITEWQIGDVIENLYEVRDIKYGGMGAVYVVRHLRWNTMMAVKSLYHRLRDSEEDRALFVKEAETWIDIGFHPNIAACYYVRNIHGSPRIFIEYADGGALNEWVTQRDRVGWDLILDLMAQGADGLGHAHSKGLVHRDVKPANCMLTRAGILKVTDFGLTKRRSQAVDSTLSATTSTSLTGTIPAYGQNVTAAGMGTPAFMAPEMWFPNAEVGPEADIYAFGVMFFEICCGRKPFVVQRGDKPNKLALAHLKKVPPRPTSIRKDMPQQIENILLRCLRKKARERYGSFSELRKDVEAAYEQLFKRAFTREPPDEIKLLSDALNNRAVSLMDLNHEAEARMALEKALESDPHHPEATYNHGLLEWQRTGDLDREVVVKMAEVVKTSQYTGRGAHLMGRLLLALGDAPGAVSACELSLSSEDATEGRLRTYAIALIGTGREEDAISHLETYLAELPNDDEARGWMIGALARLGRMDEARALMNTIRKGSPVAELSLDRIVESFFFSGLGEKLVLQGHGGWVTCVGHFPGSSRLITGSRDRSLRIWDSVTGKELKVVPVVGEPPTQLWISPNERVVAIAAAKGATSVTILDLESGVIVGRLTAHDAVTSVGFSPDGNRILAVDERGAVRLWGTTDFKAVATYKIPAHTAAAAVFDSESRPAVFFVGVDRVVKKMSLLNSDTVSFDKMHTEQVIVLKVSPRADRVVTGGRDKLAVVWDAGTGKTLGVCRAHRDQVTDVALSPNLRLAASYDAKAGIKVWDCMTGMVVRTFSVADTQMHCLDFSPDGNRVVAGGRDMVLRVWDVRGKAISLEMALARTRPVKKQMFSNREFKTMLNTAQKAVKKQAYATAYSLLRRAQTLPGYERSDIALDAIVRVSEHGWRKGLHGGWNRKAIETPSGVMDISFSSSAINFYTAHADHAIRMWSMRTGECVKVLKGHTNLVASVCLSVNGREAVSGGDDRSVRIWDLNTGRNVMTLQGHTDSVSSVTYSSDGKTVISGSWDGTLKQWRLPEGVLLRTIRAHEDKITAVAFVDEAGMMVSAGFDGQVRMWERGSGKLLRDMKGHRDRVTSLGISPGGELIITGSVDGTARIWDAKRGTCVRTLEVDDGGVRAVTFSPDRGFAMTGGSDAVLRVWNLETGACLRDFRGHSREITSADSSASGRFLATSSLDGVVIIWELDWDWAFTGKRNTGAPPAANR